MTSQATINRYLGKRVQVLRCDNPYASPRNYPLPGKVTSIAAYAGYDVYLRVALDDGSTVNYWALPRNLRIVEECPALIAPTMKGSVLRREKDE